jgi:hypothetical protein
MSIFLRKIDSAVAVPVYTISENAIALACLIHKSTLGLCRQFSCSIRETHLS